MSETTETVRLGEDERFPDYHISTSTAENAVEVPTETLARWRAAIDAYDAVQDEMSAVYEEAAERAAKAKRIAKAEAEVAAAQSRLDALKADA